VRVTKRFPTEDFSFDAESDVSASASPRPPDPRMEIEFPRLIRDEFKDKSFENESACLGLR